MSKNKVNAKREAYAKKQEEQGKKVVAWIFGALIRSKKNKVRR